MQGIYRLTFPNGDMYIGKSENVENRFTQYSRMQCERQPELYQALKNYKWELIVKEILFESYSLDIHERFYIRLYEESGASILNRQFVRKKKPISIVKSPRVVKQAAPIQKIEKPLNETTDKYIQIISKIDIFTGECIKQYNNKAEYVKDNPESNSEWMPDVDSYNYTIRRKNKGKYLVLNNCIFIPDYSEEKYLATHLKYELEGYNDLERNLLHRVLTDKFWEEPPYTHVWDRDRDFFVNFPLEKFTKDWKIEEPKLQIYQEWSGREIMIDNERLEFWYIVKGKYCLELRFQYVPYMKERGFRCIYVNMFSHTKYNESYKIIFSKPKDKVKKPKTKLYTIKIQPNEEAKRG